MTYVVINTNTQFAPKFTAWKVSQNFIEGSCRYNW